MHKSEIRTAVRHANGSTLTKVGRSANLESTAKELKTQLNIQLKSFAGLRTQHLKSLVVLWKEQGKSTRTIQNKLSHVRAALRSVGREKFADADQNSNAALGASGSHRGGTHQSISEESFTDRVSSMPEEFQAAVNLQRALGLRAQEAVQANQSLRSWEIQAKSGRPVLVLHGTKGGKSRMVNLLDSSSRDNALKAIRAAILIADKQDGKLIPSISLQGANRAFQRAMNTAGFKGSEASHAVRYMFAREQYAKYLELLQDKKEALAALSLDLGHGDKRGRYCESVYLKGGMGA